MLVSASATCTGVSWQYTCCAALVINHSFLLCFVCCTAACAIVASGKLLAPAAGSVLVLVLSFSAHAHMRSSCMCMRAQRAHSLVQECLCFLFVPAVFLGAFLLACQLQRFGTGVAAASAVLQTALKYAPKHHLKRPLETPF